MDDVSSDNGISSALFTDEVDDFKASNIDIDDFATTIRATTFSMDEMMSKSRDSLPNVEELVISLMKCCSS